MLAGAGSWFGVPRFAGPAVRPPPACVAASPTKPPLRKSDGRVVGVSPTIDTETLERLCHQADGKVVTLAGGGGEVSRRGGAVRRRGRGCEAHPAARHATVPRAVRGRYRSFETSGLERVVEARDDNVFELVVEPGR